MAGLKAEFTHHASKEKKTEATVHDIIAWCRNAGVFDHASRKCSIAYVENVAKNVRQEGKT